MAPSDAADGSTGYVCALTSSQGQDRASLSLVAGSNRADLCSRASLQLRGSPYRLTEEVDRYNNHQVHSTTSEIPALRFEHARIAGNSFFRPFSIPKPYSSPKDVFCLRETRIVNGYRKISLFNHEIEMPHVPVREQVELHLIPNLPQNALEIRFWFQQKMVHSLALPLDQNLSTFQL